MTLWSFRGLKYTVIPYLCLFHRTWSFCHLFDMFYCIFSSLETVICILEKFVRVVNTPIIARRIKSYSVVIEFVYKCFELL